MTCFFLYHYCQIHIIIITTDSFCLSCSWNAIAWGWEQVDYFSPKENTRKIIHHFIPFLTKAFSSQNDACPWGSLGIDNSGRINGELHFWWMNHLKILWHSSHDLFWRQINSLPKVAFYFMFKKPSQSRYIRNSRVMLGSFQV